MRARTEALLPAIAGFASLALADSPVTQGIESGSAAPRVELREWVNVPVGEEPSPERLHGRPLLLEFWGTWCPPCVHSMPHVQELADFYAADGLAALAISSESRDLVEPFARRGGYGLAFGCDPESSLARAFEVGGLPTTILVDERGRITFTGSPYDAEPAIERLLSLPSEPSRIFDAYLGAAKSGDRAAMRRCLERLVRKAPRAFDLSGWARGVAGSAAEGATEKTAAAPEELLASVVRALGRGDRAAHERSLSRLAAAGASAFDLLGFARAELAAGWPLRLAEVEEALRHGRHTTLLEALLHRAPEDEALGLAAADARLAAWCARAVPRARSNARKALMLERWLFAGLEPENPQAFWSELGMAGLHSPAEDGAPLEVTIGSTLVSAATAAAFADEELARALAFGSLASGRAPSRTAATRRIATERERLLKTLTEKFGSAE